MPPSPATQPDPSATIPVLQMAGITKTFPGGIAANEDLSLAAWPGEIHAVIGENGAGKSTLMNILYGRFQPDSGRIRLDGEDVRIDGPARAIALGLGMVTQHTTLIPALSVLDNVILGAEPGRGGIIDRAAAEKRVRDLCREAGVDVDPRASAARLSVAALQRAEIVKALYRGARILILDEPTATLAPAEADGLFALLHRLAAGGTTILFITHKLSEVMAHSRRVTVLRGGRMAGERLTAETNSDELLGLMLGRRGGPVTGTPMGDAPVAVSDNWTPPARVSDAPPIPVLEFRDVVVLGDRGGRAVNAVSFTVAPGEILGVAGVDGSGQRELAEALVGLRRLASGSVWLDGDDISHLGVAARQRRGIGYIPEDRHREGLVLDFSLAENLILGRQRWKSAAGGALLDLPAIRDRGDEAVKRHRVRAPGGEALARSLSGGNQQKVVIARALSGEPRLLVAMQPTRGLDVEAARHVYSLIREAMAKGLAVLLFSLDLDEVLEVSDRVAVMYNGTITGVLPRAEAAPDRVGRLMVGAAE